MDVLILSRNVAIYSTRRLAEAFRGRGRQVRILDPSAVCVRLGDGALIESVLIPEGERHTLCLSSQAGCAMGCRFCLTGAAGFARNLLHQVATIVTLIKKESSVQSRLKINQKIQSALLNLLQTRARRP